MLDTLGLDLSAEQVYRAMLAHPDTGVAALAQLLFVSEDEVRVGLDRLSALALIRPSHAHESGFRPVNPERGMELLLARQQAEIAAHQMKLEASRAAAAQLIAEYSAIGRRVVDADTEHLIGPEAIRGRLAELSDAVEEEVMTFAPGGAHSAEDLEASREPNGALLDRGVRMRTIYLESVRNDQPTRDHVNWLNTRGAQVRTALTLPVRMIIMDRRQAVLPTHAEDASIGAVILRGDGIVAALCALFDSTWTVAAPLGTAPSERQEPLPRQDREVVRLLAQGLTDEAIAKRLGVSPRTARRIAADLMTRLEARSRFEAGVHAVQNGWLPATR